MCLSAHANFSRSEPLFAINDADSRYRPFRFEDIIRDSNSASEALACSVPNEGAGSSNIFLDQGTNTLTGTASTTYYTFHPPADLVCSVSATMTGPDVSVSDDDQMCNSFVSLTSTNHQPNSTYCITASHTFPNGSCNTGACMITPGPKVTSLTYEQIQTDDLAIDDNPNVGGGFRIFPDKMLPTEAVNRRRIRVKAQYSQATAGIRIYFRNFDVDDHRQTRRHRCE